MKITTIIAFVLWAAQCPLALAQTEDDQVTDLEPITVTGSRLKRIDLETPQPVVVFTREELLASGFGTLADFADKLVYMYGPSGLPGHFVTSEQLQLRDIGGTLILVNGRRIARFASEDFQEISTIPVWAIERIEILKDGASAVYGSDAITGVVNIILRKNYDGVETSLKYQEPSSGKSDELQLGATIGSGDGRFNWMASLTAFEREGDLVRDLGLGRTRFAIDNGLIDNFLSVFGWPGSYWDIETVTISPDPECPADRLGIRFEFDQQPVCALFKGDFASTETATERYSMHATADYRLDSGLVLDTEILLSRRQTEFVFPPFAVFGDGPLFGLPFIPASHPFNPFGVDVEGEFSPVDAGLVTTKDDSDLNRYLVGASNQVGTLDWTGTLSYEQNKSTNRFTLANSARVQAALLGQGGPNGDLYYNPFGLDPENPPELLEWLRTENVSHSKSDLWLADFVVQGDLAEWDAGSAQYAAGLEYQSSQVKNNLIDADRQVAAAFIEFGLPVAESLELQLAARYEHYNDFGSTTNPKLSIRWQPLESWMFRASWSTSFRAPSLENLHEEIRLGFFFSPDPLRCPITNDVLDCRGRIETIRGGNPDLEAEDGESLFLGVAWQPEFLDEFYVELDFWDFEYSNQVAFDFSGQDPSRVTRDDPTPEDIALGIPGRLRSIDQRQINGDMRTTRGVDLEMHYTQPLKHGEFRLRSATSYQEEQEWVRIGGLTITRDGVFKPDVQSRLDLSWSQDVHELSGIIYYQSSFVQSAFDQDFNSILFPVDHQITLDLQYRFNWQRQNMDLRFGCKNCFDDDPPFSPVLSGMDWNHDGRGLILYAQVDWRLGR